MKKDRYFGFLAAVVFGIPLFLSFNSQFSKPFGLDSVAYNSPFMDGVFPSEAPTSDYVVERAFPALNFPGPVRMGVIPRTNTFYLAGKSGQVWSFVNVDASATPKEILDLRKQVNNNSDAGLLGIAFHPNFNLPGAPHNNEVFLYYNYSPGGLYTPIYYRLSRFLYDLAAGVIDPLSEQILIQQLDRHHFHGGGAMFFDKEGLLYLSVGDEGGSNDQFGNSQRIDDALFSGVLRIDVDMDASRSHPIRRFPAERPEKPASYPGNMNQLYLIPNDNPWINENGSVLEEFFAIGLRSPHSMAYDELTGDIWVADVGQGAREEINVIRKGSNAQWAYREGQVDSWFSTKPDSLIGVETPPVFDYERRMGNAAIGGFVYRGDLHLSLKGKYIFGDYGSDAIWSLDPMNAKVKLICSVPKTGKGRGIVSFATDEGGEIYILQFKDDEEGSGIILRLVKSEANPDPPLKLSETGAFADLKTLAPAEGLIPYDVNVPLWSDRAQKRRWVALPDSGEKTLGFDKSAWVFPKGTVFVKHFELPLDEQNPDSVKRIETRFLVVSESGGAYGVTYKWNAEGTDAFLVMDDTTQLSIPVSYLDMDQQIREQVWSIPSRNQCLSCHNSNGGFVLGVRTAQLNKDFHYPSSGITDNQLRTWNHLNIFENASMTARSSAFTPARSPRLYSIEDPEASLEEKVRSYLDANCSYCHQPGGVEAAFDARFTSPLDSLHRLPVIARGSSVANFIISPQDLSHSEIWVRDSSVSDNAMPPLGKTIVDEKYLQVLKAYIMSIDTVTTDSVEVVASVQTEKAIEINVYPAPFQSQLNVRFTMGNRAVGRGSITIYDIDGRVVYEHFDVPMNSTSTISADWPSGVYIVRAGVGSLFSTTRIVKAP